MNYPSTVYQVGTKLYAECNYCNGTGKVTKYTSNSDSPGTQYGTQTRRKRGHCKGSRYDKGSPVSVVKVSKE